MQNLILAFQFMTRLPMPAIRGGHLADAAVWFPLVGLVVGALVALPLVWVPDPRLAALLALVVWVWVTGGLHLDGLADLADALGAAHRDRERFIAVLADPHVGSFGVMALVLQLIAKFVLLWMLAEAHAAWWTLPLIAAWARLGALIWGQTLPPLKPGLGECFTLRGPIWIAWLWLIILVVLSLVSPVLWAVSPLLLGWWAFLKVKIGGMNGDCLGAGVELTESFGLLLLSIVIRVM